jgi:hypothetical protein
MGNNSLVVLLFAFNVKFRFIESIKVCDVKIKIVFVEKVFLVKTFFGMKICYLFANNSPFPVLYTRELKSLTRTYLLKSFLEKILTNFYLQSFVVR